MVEIGQNRTRGSGGSHRSDPFDQSGLPDQSDRTDPTNHSNGSGRWTPIRERGETGFQDGRFECRYERDEELTVGHDGNGRRYGENRNTHQHAKRTRLRAVTVRAVIVRYHLVHKRRRKQRQQHQGKLGQPTRTDGLDAACLCFHHMAFVTLDGRWGPVNRIERHRAPLQSPRTDSLHCLCLYRQRLYGRF